MCLDYRKLNNVTIKDCHPLPRIDDTLSHLDGSCWFSTLDLKSGYHQVKVAEKDKHKTAFSMPGCGLWQFIRMPFGLCSAGSTFERMMEQILAGLNYRTCLVYIDDIILFSKSFEKQIENLREVFERVKAANLKLNPKKCILFKKQVKFLGHVVSESGISTDPDKISAIKDWPIPNNVKAIRSFLGIASYYRKFILNFAQIAKPLHKLT